MWNKAVCKGIVLIVLFNKTAALDQHQCVYLPELKQRFITKIIKDLIKTVLFLSKVVVLIYIKRYNYNKSIVIIGENAMKRKNIIIIGAAGRDFHNFNTYYRNNEAYNVVAFTATQIPDIDGRKYPSELAGELYPEGIPIYSQDQLPELIKELQVDECVFAYSDISYEDVMGVSAIVNAAGANFTLLGPNSTMLKSNKPVISVCAVRTGTGKSQTSRKIIETLLEHDLKVIAVRHPMPYGDLNAQRVQRFATVEDLKKHNCTIEEMEEYEPHVARGNIVYAGVDYADILAAAENDPDGCDVILWDGGNNDFSFFKPDLAVTVLDPHRPGHELKYYPGEVCLRTTDVAIINKVDSATEEAVQIVENNIKFASPNSTIIKAESKITVDTSGKNCWKTCVSR